MRFLWVDTETTGIETEDSSCFEIGMILVDNGKQICERCFFLNPLSETILYHEDAGKINGYTKEKIESFTPEKEEVPIIASFLSEAREFFQKDGTKTEKMVFSGYNCGFDYGHIKALCERNGLKMEDYFTGVKADVFGQVKKASEAKAIPYLENRKLGTLCKYFSIDLTNAHDALADVRATRILAAKLYGLGINLL
jgi:DNA polymerase III subunit epsilon